MPTISTLTVAVDAQTTKATSKLKSLGQGLTNAGKTATIGLTLPIVAAGAAAFKMADDYNDATARIQQHIKTMGAEGTVSLDGITKSQKAFSMATGASVTELLNASGKLVTFANIAKRGTGFINEATKASADLSAAGFGSIDSAAVQLGKALDDPLKGMTSLKKVGVSFTEAQQKVITHLVETGQAAKAQGIILQAVQAQVGGTAKKIADPWDKAKASLQLAGITIGNALAPMVAKLSGYVASLFGWVSKLQGPMKTFVLILLGVLAAVGPLLLIVGKFITTLNLLRDTFKGVEIASKLAFLTNPAFLAGAAIIIITILIIKNWSKVKAFLIATWNLIKRVAITVWNGIKAFFLAYFRALVTIVRTYLNIWKAIIVGVWTAIKVVARTVWNAITAVIRTEINVTKGVILGAWHAIAGALKGIWSGIKDAARAVFAGIVAVAKFEWNGLAGLWNRTIGAIGLHIHTLGIDFDFDVPDLPTLLKGGTVLKTGLALVHEGEQFSGVGNGFGNVTVNVYGSVMTERDLAVTIQKALLKDKRRSGALGLA